MRPRRGVGQEHPGWGRGGHNDDDFEDEEESYKMALEVRKIPSEMEEAPRYKLVSTVNTV